MSARTGTGSCPRGGGRLQAGTGRGEVMRGCGDRAGQAPAGRSSTDPPYRQNSPSLRPGGTAQPDR